MPRDPADLKVELRRRIRTALRNLSTREREAGGRMVAAHLRARIERAARNRPAAPVAFFASLPYEIPTSPLDERLRSLEVRRALPAWDTGVLVFHEVPADIPAAELPPDRMGIPTPPASAPIVEPADCAVIVVPGLAFDDEGFRLGQGGGFYDRALAGLPPVGPRPEIVGICLDLQRVEAVPRAPHDLPVEAVCSPAEGDRPMRGPD